MLKSQAHECRCPSTLHTIPRSIHPAHQRLICGIKRVTEQKDSILDRIQRQVSRIVGDPAVSSQRDPLVLQRAIPSLCMF
ncbi:hypothetical protein EVAR_83409_1 [Eumeta japonica]|uniref:Uncharacterized protein n=1 Tax=Eumeta variegata TaxID=151549 RepID=A0A4C1TZR4_EUMVA|nr:hypothetical protein EVAR_83409_1 [Eumeta japonica]